MGWYTVSLYWSLVDVVVGCGGQEAFYNLLSVFRRPVFQCYDLNNGFCPSSSDISFLPFFYYFDFLDCNIPNSSP